MLNCLKKNPEKESFPCVDDGDQEQNATTVTFDNILDKINNFGAFQKLQWVLLFLSTLPQAWYSYAPVFTAMKAPKDMVTCAYGNGTIPLCKAVNGTICSKLQYNTHFTSIVTEYDMFCESSLKIAMTKSVFYIGKFIGAYMFGWMSDRYGRQIAFLSSAGIQFVASLGQTFATDYYVFTALRFPMGVCSGGNFMAAFVMITEIIGTSKRSFANAIMQSGYGVGLGLQALTAYMLPKWQHLNLAITLPNLVFIAYFWLTPESPRWNLARGNREKAEKTLRLVARVNKKEFPEDSWSKVQQDKKDEAETDKKYNLIDLFKTPYLTKVTLIECYSWLAVVLVFYGLGFNSGNLSGNVYINFAATGLIEIPANIVASIAVNIFGRRTPGCFYFITGGIALLAIVPLELTGNVVKMHKLVLALTLIGKFMATACFYQVYIHTAELYPTVIRNVGLGVASATGRIGGILAPIITDNAPRVSIPIIFGLTSLIAGVLRLLLPETKGKPYLEAIDDEIGKKKANNEMEMRMMDEKA